MWPQVKRKNSKAVSRQNKSALAVVIEPNILFLRQRRVILDTDLAQLYGVTVKRLNEQVRCNQERFPVDFIFEMTKSEYNRLFIGV